MKEVTARFLNLENVEVSNQADATAGPGKLVPFPSHRKKEMLALPTDLAVLAKQGMVDIVTFSGNSLEGIGIFDGDQGLCRIVTSRRDIKATSLCIVHLLETAETLAKRVIYRNGFVTLKSFHPDIEDMLFRPEQIKVQGIMLKLLRDPDTSGSFDRFTLPPKISKVEKSQKLNALIKRFEKPEKKEELPF